MKIDTRALMIGGSIGKDGVMSIEVIDFKNEEEQMKIDTNKNLNRGKNFEREVA